MIRSAARAGSARNRGGSLKTRFWSGPRALFEFTDRFASGVINLIRAQRDFLDSQLPAERWASPRGGARPDEKRASAWASRPRHVHLLRPPSPPLNPAPSPSPPPPPPSPTSTPPPPLS